jgi:formylglycine-generating enzyme required for sulfatase activity
VEGIRREYLINDREVTIKQFLELNPHEYFSREFGPTDDCPANVVEWREAAAFCNWLSEKEGLAAFYPQNPEDAEKCPGEHNRAERRIRGGSASFHEDSISSLQDGSFPPRIQNNSMGLRVVRTVK